MSLSQTIVVTSNVNDARNTSNHFYNSMGTPLDLSQGQWQVAIKKMIYLNSFLNIINESVTVEREIIKTVSFPLDVKNIQPKKRYYITDDKKVSVVVYTQRVALEVENDEYGYAIYVERKLEPDEISYSQHIEYGDDTPSLVSSYIPLTQPPAEWYIFEHHRNQPPPVRQVTLYFKIRVKQTYDIPAGNYEHIEDLIKALNALNIPQATFSLRDGLVHVAIKEPILELVLNNHLDITLGFMEYRLKKTQTARHLAQLNRGRFAFFIYSNLVNPVRVGDMEAPLMDVISIPKREYGETISLDVVNPLYSAVARKQISEIEIMLATDSGEPITFDNRAGNAKTLLVLHFQRAL